MVWIKNTIWLKKAILKTRQKIPLSLRMASPHPSPAAHTPGSPLPSRNCPAFPRGLSACHVICLLTSEATIKWAAVKSKALSWSLFLTWIPVLSIVPESILPLSTLNSDCTSKSYFSERTLITKWYFQENIITQKWNI